MPENQIKELAILSMNILQRTQKPLEDFLNGFAIPQLLTDQGQRKKVEDLLSDLHHLLVNCENVLKKLGIVIRSNQFNKELTENVLYETVHACINKFYYPEHEVYEEDGRNSYTGKDAIKFSFTPHPEIKNVIIKLSKEFEILREELVYYETDYVTKKRLEGKML